MAKKTKRNIPHSSKKNKARKERQSLPSNAVTADDVSKSKTHNEVTKTSAVNKKPKVQNSSPYAAPKRSIYKKNNSRRNLVILTWGIIIVFGLTTFLIPLAGGGF